MILKMSKDTMINDIEKIADKYEIAFNVDYIKQLSEKVIRKLFYTEEKLDLNKIASVTDKDILQTYFQDLKDDHIAKIKRIDKELLEIENLGAEK